jgi:hypothetical protein
MNRQRTVIHKHARGLIRFNDGYFAVVETFGVEGIEKDLLLKEIQLDVDDTEMSVDEFKEAFPVGMDLSIQTTTAVTRLEPSDLIEANNRGKQRVRDRVPG